MAKETTIIFVYDTELLKKEEDDPNSAILYFYPEWVSDQRKTILCGQLMGTIICMRELFSFPKIVSLQTGKFCCIENERYILAVGCDKNIPDWILEHRMHLVFSLVKFFHKDFVNLSRLYENEALSAKLFHMFDSYMKILLCGHNIFGQVFLFHVQKNTNSAITEATAILESCREFGNILGGSIMFHNKIVSTQLSPTTTKLLVLSDPFRIKNPAEVLRTNFELPDGVQLLQVYIPNKEFCDLLENSLQSHYIFQFFRNKNIKKTNIFKKHDTDTSLLFTTVPEEDVQSTTETSKLMQKKPRPKSLNLRSISTDSSDSQYSFKTTPMTPFCGQNSMVDTPMTEFKTFIREDITEKEKEMKSEAEKLTEEKPTVESLKPSSSLSNLLDALNGIVNNPLQYSNQKNKIIASPKKSIKLKRSKSLHDPSFPLFRDNGMALSGQDTHNILQNPEPTLPKSNNKKSLTLPLKPIELQNSKRRYSTGVQLTPLMNRLTSLALEEQIYNGKFNVTTKRSKPLKPEEIQKCGLFIFGQKDIVLTLLVKEELAKDKETVLKLHELCIKHLPQLETKLNSFVESQCKAPINRSEHEPYSFLCLDDQWDLVKHCGPWDLTEESVLNTVHADFKKGTDISEILIRRPESTIYSYHNTSCEIFYHENSSLSQGLLSPTDSMGSVQARAKQRLERDHSIIL